MSLKAAFASTALSFLALATGQGALIAEYTFDYNSGIDTAGGFDLNFIGSNPSFPGGTYQSDGVSANYLGVTGPGGVPDFTISLWVNSPVVNQGNFKGIFSNLNNTGAFSWQVDSHSGQYRLVANTAGISENLGTPTAGAWENIVIQKYGGGSYRAYFNGTEIVDEALNPGGLQMFRVGINRTGDNSFTGQIGLVQIWNDSAQDAAALFAAGPGVVPEPSRAAFLALGLGAMMLRRRR